MSAHLGGEAGRFVWDDAQVEVRLPVNTRSAEWNESDHPRDDQGQFTDGGGGSSAGTGTAINTPVLPLTPVDKVWGGDDVDWSEEDAVDKEPSDSKTAAVLERLAPPPAANSSEKDSIVEYQSDSDLINTHLRSGGIGAMNPDKLDSEEIDQARELEAHIANIEEAMSRSPLQEAVKVYRGVQGAVVDKLKVGTVFKDEAFVSTSYSEKAAKQFAAGRKKAALLHITVPKGTPALHINKILGDRSEMKTEREVLLPRGLQLKITRIKGSTIYAKVVGHGK